ncbi:MAG: hypothetical protein H7Y18_16740 [Clostridiaceae bacterium]|nr:hypothetical protein [Clostridiaceae bacterium]
MMIVMLGLKLIIDEKEHLNYFEKYVLEEKHDKKYKEYLLTYTTEFIRVNLISINREDIKNYFKIFGESLIASYEKSYIRYSIDSDCFILIYQYEDGILKKDKYNYEVVDEMINYTYTSSIYESGRII